MIHGDSITVWFHPLFAPKIAYVVVGELVLLAFEDPLAKGNPLEARTAVNERRAIVLAVAFATSVFAIITLVLVVVGLGWIAPLVGLLVAGGWIAIAMTKADEVVLRLCDAEIADSGKHARLVNVTNGLCAAMGLSTPSLYVVDDPALNALATGSDQRHASMVVTQGLLDHLDLIELEAVVALQLERIKSGAIIPETVAVLTVGVTGVLSDLADQWGWLHRFLALPNPLIEATLVRLHPPRREIDADLAAMEVTRYPPALASALEKMAGHSAVGVASPVTAHLWAAAPLPVASNPRVVKVHLPLAERISVLQEL